MKTKLFLLLLLALAVTATANAQNNLQSDYNKYTVSNNVFYDDFSKNDYGWYTGAIENCRIHTLIDGYYELKSNCTGQYTTCNFNQDKGFSVYGNFEIETSIQFVSGEDNGANIIGWGMDKTGNKFFFGTSGNGQYLIRKYSNGKFSDIKSWTVSELIRKNQFNKLTIRGYESQYFFYINENLVYTCPYETFFGQRLQFMANQNSTVRFDYIRISNIVPAFEQTIDVTTSGTLKSKINAVDYKKISKLTLSGNIDARDIKFIRDSIKNLVTLDIANVKITEYKGKDGPFSYEVKYNENELPNESFKSNYLGHFPIMTIILPKSLTSIGRQAFESCYDLENIIFSDQLTTIADKAFKSCIRLKNIEIPSSLTKIGSLVFLDCDLLKNIKVSPHNPRYSDKDGVLYSIKQDTIFIHPNAKTEYFKIPETVKHIGDEAFYEFPNTVYIPKSVISIGNYSFQGSKIESFENKEKNIKYIGKGAFQDCNSLRFLDLTKIKAIESDAFKNCGKIENVFIEEGTTQIGAGAFANCKSLKSVSISKSVNYIGLNAFNSCENLKQINVIKNNKKYCSLDGVLYDAKKDTLLSYPAGKYEMYGKLTLLEPIKVVKRGSFDSSKIINLTLPQTLVKVEDYSFWGSALLSISVPKSAALEKYALFQCKAEIVKY